MGKRSELKQPITEVKTPKEFLKIYMKRRVSIFQVWLFSDFISSNGNSNNSEVESQQRFLKIAHKCFF